VFLDELVVGFPGLPAVLEFISAVGFTVLLHPVGEFKRESLCGPAYPWAGRFRW
jgi:hypothetical protein